MDIVEIEKNIPDFVKNMKDCWLIAMILVCVCMKRDYRILFLNLSFQYTKKSDCCNSFKSIVYNHMDIELCGQIIDDAFSCEDECLHKLLNFRVEYYSTIGLDEEKRTFLKEKIIKNIAIIWIDTFKCSWNPMYKKEHLLHCITLVKTNGNRCYVYDTLKDKEKFFIESIDNLLEQSIYMFIYEEKEDDIKELETAYQIYKNDIVKKSKFDEKVVLNLHSFYNDINKLQEKGIQELYIYDENIMKLMIRLFENQYERSTLQINVYRSIPNVSFEMIGVLECIKKYWKMASIAFARMCFAKNEKKEEAFHSLCIYVEIIEKNTKTFYGLINR